MKKLSNAQREVLERMRDGATVEFYIWGGEKCYGARSPTMWALLKCGYVERHVDRALAGHYTITPAGIAALEARE